MNHSSVKQTTVNAAFVVTAVLVAAFTARGRTQTENLLLSAGFQVKAATTVSQRQELQRLAKARLSGVTQNKKPFYVYPDAQHNQIYVGEEAAYQTYLDKIVIAGGSEDSEMLNADYTRTGQAKLPELRGWDPFDGITK
jgi:hypothetical protein